MTRRPAAAILMVATLAATVAGCATKFPAANGGTSGGGPGGTAGVSASPAATGPTVIPAYKVGRLIRPHGGKYLGVFPDGPPGSLAPVRSFAASAGRKPNIIGHYLSWNSPFNAQAVANAWSYGSLYYMSWEPFGTTPQAIADGRSDAYITRFANAVRALNLPVAMSFGHEMNGNWYPWGTGQATAAQFVAAWRRIHNLFHAAGATNVIWIWNPNVVTPMPQVQLQPYYPGNAYVDWIGVTGYFPAFGPQTFATLYQSTMQEIRAFTHKPFIIAETSVESGPAQVECANHLVDSVASHPNVLGFIWFDFNKDGVDWRIESRPAVQAVIAQDLAPMKLVGVR